MLFYMQGPFISMTILTASEVDASALILVRILELEILPSLSTLNIVKYGPSAGFGISICTLYKGPFTHYNDEISPFFDHPPLTSST